MEFSNNKKVSSKILEVQEIINELKECDGVMISEQMVQNKLNPLKNQIKDMNQEYRPQPRRLTFIHCYECDLCSDSMKKDDNDNFIVKCNYTLSIIPKFGFIYCNKCKDNNLQYKAYLNYIKNEKAMSMYTFNSFNNFVDIDKKYKVKRSSGIIEDDWELDNNRFVTFKDDDWMIPVVKYIENDSIVKHFNLKIFSELNNFDYQKFINNLYSLINMGFSDFVKLNN
tara:strand:+ start:81 stop:758 length:678 start_codon:yes stop_codon:yes gene_type:complete